MAKVSEMEVVPLSKSFSRVLHMYCLLVYAWPAGSLPQAEQAA